MPPTLLIEGRTFGRQKALFPDWSMPLPPEWETSSAPLTLRDLITRIVQEEIQAFHERRDQRRLIHVLTESQIAAGVQRGKVEMGGREEDEPTVIDPQAAVITALQAFEDGLYYVFVGDEHRQNLDDVIRIQPEVRVTFLRLVALAGG